MEVVEIDAQGRIYLPSRVRSKLSHTRFRVTLEGDRIVLTPVKPNIEKYYGVAGKPRYRTSEEIDEAVRHETERILREDVH